MTLADWESILREERVLERELLRLRSPSKGREARADLSPISLGQCVPEKYHPWFDEESRLLVEEYRQGLEEPGGCQPLSEYQRPFTSLSDRLRSIDLIALYFEGLRSKFFAS